MTAKQRSLMQFWALALLFGAAVVVGIVLNVLATSLGLNAMQLLGPLFSQVEGVASSVGTIFLNNLAVGLLLVVGALLVGRLILAVLVLNGGVVGFVGGYFIVLGGLSFSHFLVATVPHALFEMTGLLGFACLSVNVALRRLEHWRWGVGVTAMATLNLLIGAYLEMHLTPVVYEMVA